MPITCHDSRTEHLLTYSLSPILMSYDLVVFQIADVITINAPENSWYGGLYGIDIKWYPLIVAPLIILVGMIRSMKILSRISAVANACLLAGGLGIYFYLFFGEVKVPIEPQNQAKWFIWSIGSWALFAGSTLCSLEGIGMVSTASCYLFLL